MSQAIAYVEINGFALVILFLIYFNMRFLQDKFLTNQKMFVALIGSTAGMLVLDTLLWVVDGQPGALMGTAFMALAVVFFSCGSIPFILWNIYVTLQVTGSISGKRTLFLCIPGAATLILSISTIFSHSVFYVNEANSYVRGNLFFAVPALWLFNAVYEFVLLFRYRKKTDRRLMFRFLSFLILPIVAGALQVAFYGLSLIWVSVAVALQIVFMSIQNGSLYMDYLTGLYNRRQLDSYLDERMKFLKPDVITAGIMLDLDSFKEINDRLGHAVGDLALADAAQILRMSFRKTDMICRYGGDEFVVIIDREREEQVSEALNKLEQNIGKFNGKGKHPYSLRFSIGYDIFDFASGTDSREFMNHIDTLMYENKKQVKEQVQPEPC